ncbi:MAG: multicopper oxidase domain-containing protein [Acidiferrobacterales bacterium]
MASNTLAASASLSTDSIIIAVDETGSWTISGNDGGDQLQLRWSLPSGLDVTKGSSSNLNKFDIKWDKGYVKVESDGKGSFSATIKVSSGSAGTYVMKNIRDEFGISPKDITVNVGDSSGGSTSGSSTDTSSGSSSGSGTADYTLYIREATINITSSPVTGNGSTTLSGWTFASASSGATGLPGVLLESVEGGNFTVEVVNNLNRDHNFVIQGVTSDTASISPGDSRTYTVNTPDSGVYFYRDTLNNNINRSLGLFGALVVRPSASSKRAWSGGPSFDQQRLWVINDMDVPRWNDVALSGGNVDTAKYRPNYFLMNGMNGFQAMGDAATAIEGNVGETFLVRIVNAGQFDQSLHWHGNHFQVISRNGNRLSAFEWQDTINVKAGTTAMTLYKIEQPGHFPMHVHTAQMETGNGVYLNGTAAMIIGH